MAIELTEAEKKLINRNEEDNDKGGFELTEAEKKVFSKPEQDDGSVLTDVEKKLTGISGRSVGGEIDDIVKSLEGTEANSFLSAGWFKNFGKQAGNRLDNAWHTITDKDNSRGIYDYSQYKEYKKQIEAAEEAGNEVDRDLIYQSMANEGIIDYDKFIDTIDDEYVDQYGDYKKALAQNKENFSNELKDRLSPYMQRAANSSYQINALTKAIEKMVDQRQMLVDDVMTTYKDTRDPNLISYIKTVINDYDNAIKTFTEERAKSLTMEGRKAGGAYYDVLNDTGMRDLANSIQKIQYRAHNKMSGAAVQDNFKDCRSSFTKGNFISGFGELVGGILNAFDWGFNQVGEVFEEGKQALLGMYDVVEELNHLNVYADDASGFRKAFGTLGSWTMSVIDALPELGPAVLDIILGEKIGTLSKAAKAIKMVDKVDDAASLTKKASWFTKVIEKGKFKGLVKIGDTKGKMYLDEVLKDILIYDVAFQQFEGHPLTTDEMTLNFVMNLPLDGIAVALRKGPQYFKPEMAANLLTDDSISRELMKQLKEGIEKGYSDKKLAEIYYMGKSIEENNPPKEVFSIKEGLETKDAEFFKKVKQIQEESTKVWDRLTKFEGDIDDMLAEMESRVRKKTRRKGSNDEIINEGIQNFFVKSNMAKVFADSLRVRGNLAFIGGLIDNGKLTDKEIPLLKAAIYDAAGKNEGAAQALFGMWLGNTEDIINGLKNNTFDGTEIDRILQETILNLYRGKPDIISDATFINGFIKNPNKPWEWRNLFTGEVVTVGSAGSSKKEVADDIIQKIFKQDYRMQDIQLYKMADILSTREADEKGLVEISDMFDFTNTITTQKLNNIEGKPEGILVDTLFKKLGIKKEVTDNGVSLKMSKKKLQQLADSSASFAGAFNLDEMTDMGLAAYKLMFLDEYVSSFENYISTTIKATNGNITETELKKEAREYMTYLDKIEDGKAAKTKKNLQKGLHEGEQKDLKLGLKDYGAEHKKELEDIIKDGAKGKKTWAQTNADICNVLWKHTVTHVKKVGNKIDEADLREQFIQLMDNVVSPNKADMLEDIDKRGFEGDIRQVKIQEVENLQKSKELLADKMIDFIRQFGADIKSYREIADIAGKFLGTVSQSPYALSMLAKGGDDRFLNTIFSRMLIDDGTATTAYLVRGQQIFDELVKNGKDISMFKDMGKQIEVAVELAKKRSIGGAKRADLIKTLNRVQGLYNGADYVAGKKTVNKGYKSLSEKIGNKFSGGSIDILKTTDEDINQIADYLARQQMIEGGLYSLEAYKKIKQGFTDGLNRIKEIHAGEKEGPKFTVTKGKMAYNLNGDVELGVMSTNVLLGNLDNIDMLGKISIGHEFEHQNIFRSQLVGGNKEITSLGGSIKSYIKALQDAFKNNISQAADGSLDNLFNSIHLLSDEDEFTTLINDLSEDSVIEKLVEIGNKIFNTQDATYLTKEGAIQEALLSNPLFSLVDEIITECSSMSRMMGAGYNFNSVTIDRVNEILDKAYEAAELIDRFRCMFFDSNIKNIDDINRSLHIKYNVDDVKEIPAHIKLIEDKVFGGSLVMGKIPEKDQIITPNHIVNELWMRGNNMDTFEDDIYNNVIKIPKGKKLVFFDLETTTLRNEGLEGKEIPEIYQCAYKVVSGSKDGNKANVVSKYYTISEAGAQDFQASVKHAKAVDKEIQSYETYTEGLAKQGKNNTTFAESQELKDLQKLAKDKNTIFVFHNGLQFDLPLVQRLGVDVPESRCIDTLQVAKGIKPFEGTWAQDELVVSIKNIREAGEKFTKETGVELVSHNAASDVQQLWYVFGHLYNHLVKNGKVKPGASSDDILKEMKKITGQMQHTPKGQYVKDDFSQKKFLIEWGKGRAVGLAGILATAMKTGEIDYASRNLKKIRNDIIKNLKLYEDRIVTTDLKGIVDKVQYEDMVKQLEGMSDDEVVAFAQRIDGIRGVVPDNISKPKRHAIDIIDEDTDDVIDFYDYIDFNSVDGQSEGLVESVTKKLSDKVVTNEKLKYIREKNTAINDALLKKSKGKTVNVAKALQTMKGELGEAGDFYLDILIDLVNKKAKGLTIGVDKLIVGDNTIAAYSKYVQDGGNKDFNIFCINRIFNNVLALDERLGGDQIIKQINDGYNLDMLNVIAAKLSLGKVISGKFVANKDTTVLRHFIDNLNKSINVRLENTALGKVKGIDVDEVLRNYPITELDEFNNLIIKYIRAFQRGESEKMDKIGYSIYDNLMNNLSISLSKSKSAKGAYGQVLPGDKAFKEYTDIKYSNKSVNNRQPIYKLNTILNRVNEKLGINNKDTYKYLSVDLLDMYDEGVRRLGRKVPELSPEMAKEEVDDLVEHVVAEYLYMIGKSKKLGKNERAIKDAALQLRYVDGPKSIVNDEDFKLLSDDLKQLNEDVKYIEESEIYDPDYISKRYLDSSEARLDQSMETDWIDEEDNLHAEGAKIFSLFDRRAKNPREIADILESKYGITLEGKEGDLISDRVEKTIKKLDEEGKLKDMPDTVFYDLTLNNTYRDQLMMDIEDVLNLYRDNYKLRYKDNYRITDGVSDTSKGFSINQGIFFNQARLSDKEISNLFPSEVANKFMGYNKGIYGNDIISHISRHGLRDNQTARVVFADGLDVKITKDGIELPEDKTVLNLIDSLITSIQTRGGTSITLADDKNILAATNIPAFKFWNSLIGQRLADELGISGAIGVNYAVKFNDETVDEIFERLAEEGFSKNIEGYAPFQKIYYDVLCKWEGVNLVPLDGIEDTQIAKNIIEERNKNYKLVQKLKREIEGMLQNSDYAVGKQSYISDLEKFQDLSFHIYPDKEAQYVRIVDEDGKLLEELDRSDEVFELYKKDNNGKLQIYAERPAAIKEYKDLPRGKTIDRWSAGDREIKVKLEDGKYVVVDETPIKKLPRDAEGKGLKVNRVKQKYQIFYSEGVRYNKAEGKFEEIKVEKPGGLVEGPWHYLSELIDEQKGYNTSENMFEDIRALGGEYEYPEPYYGDEWTVEFIDDYGNLYDGRIKRTMIANKDGIYYPTYKVIVDASNVYHVPDRGYIATEGMGDELTKLKLRKEEKETDKLRKGKRKIDEDVQRQLAKEKRINKKREKLAAEYDKQMKERQHYGVKKTIPGYTASELYKETLNMLLLNKLTRKVENKKYLDEGFKNFKNTDLYKSTLNQFEQLTKKDGFSKEQAIKAMELTKEEEKQLDEYYERVDIDKRDFHRGEIEDYGFDDDGEYSIIMGYNQTDGWRQSNVHKELETDAAGGAVVGGYYKPMLDEDGNYIFDQYGILKKEWVEDENIYKGKRVNGLADYEEEYKKVRTKQQQGRYSDIRDRFKGKENNIEHRRYMEGDTSGISEKDKELNRQLEIAKKKGSYNKSIKSLNTDKFDLDTVNRILAEGDGELPVTQGNELGFVGRQLVGLTNKSIIRNDKTVRQIVGARDSFLQANGDKLDKIVDRWNNLMQNRTNEEQDAIFDAFHRVLNNARRSNKENLTLIDISHVDKEADEIINDFAKVMSWDNKWKNMSVLSMLNTPKSMFDIVAKMKNTNLIAAMGMMNWTKQDAFEYMVRSARLQGITDPKRLKEIAQDFVGDPLGIGNWQNGLQNLRSINRFLKYSVPAPISGTVMLLNGTLLGEQMYRAKKRGLSGLMDNEIFEKICLNENLLKVFNRGEDIVLHGNTDMDVGTIAFDRGLKNIADALTKEGTKAREVAETVMLGGIHSLQDLTYNAKVRVLAFAQALQQRGITELQLEDILKKIESGEMFSNPKYLQAWNDIMAMTEYYYDDFFTNSATAFMSRNKFSRLWIFNNLQGYVIKRSDEIGRAITGFKNWLAAKPKGAHYNWGDFVDHLEKNQELKAFLNNILLSTKLAFYLNRADMADGKDGDNLYRYAIEANDYLSSLPATFFYQLLSAPFKGYDKYKTYQDITGQDGTFADGTAVALMNTLSQVCSQFFRESKPLMALMDTAVAYGKTGDLGFAASVMGTDLAKISNGIGRFGLIDGIEKYGLEDFSQGTDVIGQMLLAGNETSKIGKSIQDSYDVTFVDNVLNDKGYAFMSAIGNLPLIGEILKESTDKGGFTFNEAKVKELEHMLDNDPKLQAIYRGEIDANMYDDEAINRIYNDFVSFNYPYKSLKSLGKHDVGTYNEGVDTSLNSMKENVFVQNICEKLNMSIEEFHDYITKAGYDSDKVGRLKMLAAAEAAEPGSGKIILSYIISNRLYELEKQTTGKNNPRSADIPENIMAELKRQVIQEFATDEFIADRTSQYKVMREYISMANPSVFKSLKNDNKLQGYANSIGFLDMLVRQAALDGDCNASYFKNVFSLSSKYVKDDAARLALMRHGCAAIDETDLDASAKMIAKEGMMAGNIDIYDKVKDNPMFRALYPGVLEDFEHRIWGIKDYVNITGGYSSGYSNGSYSQKYGDSNDKLQDGLMKKINDYTNPFSKNYVPREGTYAMSTPKGTQTRKGDLDFYYKLYEALIKDYSDNLVKSEGKKYPAEKIAGMTYKSGGLKDLNRYGHIKSKQLYFPKHKQPKYSTKTISNLPGASG